MIVLLFTYYQTFYSPFFLSLKKAAHVKHFFYFIYFYLHKKKKNEKEKEKLLQKMFTQWKLFNKHSSFKSCLQTFFVYLLLFTDFFTHFFICLADFFFFFDLKLPILVFRRSRAVLQKRINLSW